MFNLDDKKYFCNNCMFESPIETFNSNQPVIEQEKPIEQEKITDTIIDPEILINQTS